MPVKTVGQKAYPAPTQPVTAIGKPVINPCQRMGCPNRAQPALKARAMISKRMAVRMRSLTEVLSDLDGNILAEREALRKPAIPRPSPRHLQVAIQGLKVQYKLAQSHEHGATPRRRLNAGTNPALEMKLTPGTTTLLLGNYERPPCKRLTLS